MTVATVVLAGKKHRVEVQPEQTILAALRNEYLPAPFLCARGECGTCIARLIAGSVRMVRNQVLDAEDLAEGYVLTCQSIPVTDAVTVEYL